MLKSNAQYFLQNKRTPLHYAAALRDGGYFYKLMRKSGADPNIFDCVSYFIIQYLFI